jgi:enoyl-CoA hydratase
MSDVVNVTASAGVRTLTLNRPKARNAMNTALLVALCAALEDADNDEATSVIVLTGEDPAFCAGLDLAEFADPEADLLRVVHTPGSDPFGALKSLSKPVIAAVNGPAMTGGLELALNCDFILASDRARFADSHAKVGAIPGGGTTGLLPQAVGLRQAKELSFTGRVIDAAEALRIGLVNHVVAHEELPGVTASVGEAIAGGDQRAIRELRRLYDAGSLVTLAECHRLEEEAYNAWELPASEVARRRDDILAAGKRAAAEA